MPAAMTTCTLPLVQLMCNIVGLETLSNFTNSVLAPDQTTLQSKATFLPDGYDTYPEISAYKVYNYDVTFMEAKNRCAQDGAQLAVMDSFEKLEYFRRMTSSSEWVHAGVIRMDDTWVSGKTGLRVSVPWEQGYPYDNTDCVFLCWSKNGLLNQNCGTLAHFICEFPIFVNSTIVVAGGD